MTCDDEALSAQANGTAPTGTDTLADSVVILLVLTVAQRLVGFVRSVLFCRWLDADQLGQWDIAYGFLVLAAPLAVLGLPGSFGRYVEHYRRSGQLRAFIQRTSMATLVLLAAAVLSVIWLRGPLSRLIFGSEGYDHTVVLLALGLGAFAAHNFFTSLFTALRMVRVVSAMQFFNSLGFALAGVGLLQAYQATATSVVAAFAAASVVTSTGAALWLRRTWRTLPGTTGRLPQWGFWRKVMPFAVWLWVTNWVANVFDLVDRYMIVHYSGLDAVAALEQVGQYHSSRLIPVLFVGVAELLSSMIVPHLSHDWESGRRDEVSSRLNLVLKLMAFCFTAGAALVLLVAPMLFRFALADKYAMGLTVLPWTLCYCIWAGLAAVAINYLWCAERARLASLTFAAGLIVNVSLNLILLPRFGLQGAVLATAAGYMTVVLLLYLVGGGLGLRLQSSTWLISLAPALLCLGPGPTIAVLLALWLQVVMTNRVLNASEKLRLAAVWQGYSMRLRFRRRGEQALT